MKSEDFSKTVFIEKLIRRPGPISPKPLLHPAVVGAPAVVVVVVGVVVGVVHPAPPSVHPGEVVVVDDVDDGGDAAPDCVELMPIPVWGMKANGSVCVKLTMLTFVTLKFS